MEHKKLGQNSKNRSGIGQDEDASAASARLAKTHEDYWKGRLRHRSYKNVTGKTVHVPEWQVKLFHDGKQRWVNLETSNRDAAAKKARDYWLKLRTLGWDAVKPRREKVVDPSIGQFLAAVRAEADLESATFQIYAKKFRRLVSGVVGIEGGPAKHDYRGGGAKEWLARVESVKLSRLSSEAVQRWKTRYLATAGTNPINDRRAKRTIASVLRSSKALFAPGIMSRLHMDLPDPLPLANVDPPSVRVSQYVSRINPALLYQQAQRELAAPTDGILRIAAKEALQQSAEKRLHRERSRPRAERSKKRTWTPSEEAQSNWLARGVERERRMRAQMFRAFCCALFAGLRRDEIDTLTWTQVDTANHLIRVETNEFTRAKSEGSEAGVDIDPTFSELLRSWMKASQSKFVIEVNVDPRPSVSTYHHYRADCVFKRLNAWLRAHGVEERNAVHALRKEFGTQINRTHGLFAASAALRHSSIQLTRAVYVAKKDRAVFAMPSDVSSNNSEEKIQTAAITS